MDAEVEARGVQVSHPTSSIYTIHWPICVWEVPAIDLALNLKKAEPSTPATRPILSFPIFS